MTPEHLVKYLRGNTTVADAVGVVSLHGIQVTPIVSEMRGPLTETMPRRAIVVEAKPTQFMVGRNHPLQRGNFDVKCYGRTVDEAWDLHATVYGVLRHGKGRRRMNGYQVTGLRPASTPVQYREQRGGWPYVWTEYTMTITEEVEA